MIGQQALKTGPQLPLIAGVDKLERTEFELGLRDRTVYVVMKGVRYRVPFRIAVEKVDCRLGFVLNDCERCKVPNDSPIDHMPGDSSWNCTAEIGNSENFCLVNFVWWLRHRTMVTFVFSITRLPSLAGLS